MMEYSQVQEDFRDKTKVMIQRQLQITTGKQVSEGDVDEMIEKGNLQVFTQDVGVANILGAWQTLSLIADFSQYCSATTGIKWSRTTSQRDISLGERHQGNKLYL